MLAELRNIEMEKAVKMNAEKNIPPFNPGDAIEVKV
jgi:ribosomal protein L19